MKLMLHETWLVFCDVSMDRRGQLEQHWLAGVTSARGGCLSMAAAERVLIAWYACASSLSAFNRAALLLVPA